MARPDVASPKWVLPASFYGGIRQSCVMASAIFRRITAPGRLIGARADDVQTIKCFYCSIDWLDDDSFKCRRVNNSLFQVFLIFQALFFILLFLCSANGTSGQYFLIIERKQKC